MEAVQGFTRRQEIESVTSSGGGVVGWIVGALEGWMRTKWRTASRVRVQQMQLIETLSLGGKRQVMLINCEGERYLVGCGTDSVATIVKATRAIDETQPTAKRLAQTWF